MSFSDKRPRWQPMREPAYPLFEKRRNPRRGIFELRLDIMRALRYEPKRILRVSMETNQSYLPLRSNIEFMAEKGLVGVSKVPPRTKRAKKPGMMVFLTRKGQVVLEKVEAAYAELLDLKSHEEDLFRDDAWRQEKPLERMSSP